VTVNLLPVLNGLVYDCWFIEPIQTAVQVAAYVQAGFPSLQGIAAMSPPRPSILLYKELAATYGCRRHAHLERVLAKLNGSQQLQTAVGAGGYRAESGRRDHSPRAAKKARRNCHTCKL
jgi:hypothetical protein